MSGWWHGGVCSSIIISKNRGVEMLRDLWKLAKGYFLDGYNFEDRFNLLGISGDNCIEFVRKVLRKHKLSLQSNNPLPHYAALSGLSDDDHSGPDKWIIWDRSLGCLDCQVEEGRQRQEEEDRANNLFRGWEYSAENLLGKRAKPS